MNTFMFDYLNESQRTLLRYVANSLFDADMPSDDADPAQIWREANMQAVFLTAFKNADISSFPESLQLEIRNTISRVLTRNLRIALAHAQISSFLESHGIAHVLIKGYASAEWYPEPELRQMGDIDFYISPDDVERTEALLSDNGYTLIKASHKIHHVFTKDGCRYELHFGIPGMPDGAAGDRCRRYFKTLLSESSIRKTPFGEMRTPSAFHHGLILLLHTAHHLTNSGVGLRHLCDWAVFVSATSGDKEMQQRFSAALHEIGLLRFAACLTELCVQCFGCRAMDIGSIRDPELQDALLEDIFKAGNFGQKDVVRSREAYLITSGKNNGSKLRRLFSVMLDMIYQKWPRSKKYKILVPFGWIYFSLVYALKALSGKKPKLHAVSAVKGAQERTRLYDRLRLFDNNEVKQ